MPTKDKIIQLLQKSISLECIEVTDETLRHHGHSEALKNKGGHFRLKISSSSFKGKTLLECHQLIYQILRPLLGKEIHALSIQTVFP